jgi:hypothetical protein
MKRNLYRACCILLLLCIALSSCQNRANEESFLASVPSGDTSRELYFYETHGLSDDHPCGLYDVTITKIFTKTYPEGFSEKCLLLECNIKHIFCQTPSADSGVFFATIDNPILLWIDVDDYDSDTIAQLVSLFESIDSAIIYGDQIQPQLIQNSTLCKQLESELDEDQIDYCYDDGSSILKLPPCLKIDDLYAWPVVPIVGGSFSADCITSILGVSSMAFSFDSEQPSGFQYFKNGDDVSEVYNALDRFISEYLRR